MAKNIRFKNNKYYFRTYATLESGERKQIERVGGKTEKEAERALMKFKLEYEETAKCIYLIFWIDLLMSTL